MAYAFFDIVPETGAGAIFALKELLKAQGWTVLASGDGTAFGNYSAVGDILTSGDAVANGFDNIKAWFRITSPDAQIEFTVQRGTLTYQYRIKYSRAGKFTGAPTGGGATDADTTPSAADEQFVAGAGTDAAPTYTTILYTTNGLAIYKAGADDAAPYTFYLVGCQAGGTSGAVLSAWTFDACTDLVPGDAEPYVHYVATTNALITTTLNTTTGGPYSFLPSAAPATWQRYPCVQYTQNSLNAAIPQNVPTSAIQKKDAVASLWIARRTADANPGYKGRLTMMKWRGFQRTNGQTLTLSTDRDHIGFGDVVFPWGGTASVT